LNKLDSRLKIDIISDVVCPWCYVGKKKLERAIAQAQLEDQVDIEWRPFQLVPELPKSGVPYREHLLKKFGSEKALLGAFQNLTSIGIDLGIRFAFEKIQTAPNTAFLHALIKHLSPEAGQGRLVQAFFQAHFEEGIDLADRKAISDIASQNAIDQKTFDSLERDTVFLSHLQNEFDYYRQNGVNGVPTFILDSQLAVTGAQDPEVFLEIFQRLAQDRAIET